MSINGITTMLEAENPKLAEGFKEMVAIPWCIAECIWTRHVVCPKTREMIEGLKNNTVTQEEYILK